MIAETHAASLRGLLITARLDVEAMMRKLANAGGGLSIELERAASIAQAKECVRASDYDVILLDGGSNNDVEQTLLRHVVGDGVFQGPFLLFLDKVDRETERAACEAGASDALELGKLGPPLFELAIRYAVARRRSEEQLAALQLFDSATGLARQPLFWETLALAVKRARRHRDHLAVLLLHVDGLALGPSGSDLTQHMARAVAGRLTTCLRASDTVARFDHDQFVGLVEGMPRVEDIQIVAEKLIEAVTRPIDVDSRGHVLAVSMGIAMYPAGALSAEGLIHGAVNAMLYARERGGNAFHFH